MNLMRHSGTSSSGRSERSYRLAFTLVEMLVVIGIIGVLASVVLAALPGVARKRDRAKVTAMRVKIETAIQAYHAYYGAYPPDTGMETTNTLFYELSGTDLLVPPNQGFVYRSPVDGIVVPVGNFTNTFNGIDGILNVNYGPTKAKNFLDMGSGDFATVTTRTSPPTNTFSFLTVPAGVVASSGNGISNLVTLGRRSIYNPWHYAADNPKHNRGEYDLWAVYQSGSQIFTNGNWGKN